MRGRAAKRAESANRPGDKVNSTETGTGTACSTEIETGTDTDRHRPTLLERIRRVRREFVSSILHVIQPGKVRGERLARLRVDAAVARRKPQALHSVNEALRVWQLRCVPGVRERRRGTDNFSRQVTAPQPHDMRQYSCLRCGLIHPV